MQMGATGAIASQVGQFLQRKKAEGARLESETRFRHTFELAAVGIAHVGLDGRFLRVNRGLCDLLGYAEGELVGRTARDISHPQDREIATLGLARLRAGKQASYRFEKRYVRKNGAVAWMQVNIALVRNAQREPQYEISVCEDITERKKHDEELRRFRLAMAPGNDSVAIAPLCCKGSVGSVRQCRPKGLCVAAH
jgi:PAS domain S-box-containing protein